MANSLVLKEALSIPDVIGKFAFSDKNPYQEIANLINQKKIKYIVTVARGTSDCAALYSSYIFAKYLGLPTYSMPPSIITLENCRYSQNNQITVEIVSFSELFIYNEFLCLKYLYHQTRLKNR